MNRRNFLNATAKTTVAISAASVLPTTARSQARVIGANDRIRVGLIKANSAEKDTFLISDLKLELRTVNRREKTEGTRLPVGKPVLDVARYNLKLKVREHKNYGILIRPKGDARCHHHPDGSRRSVDGPSVFQLINNSLGPWQG
ncbi:MAG: hypothetical protein O3C21_17785 [Verrucomicrobia bacterium]|nr:hypothetical protein [Verrucomicrobiota bacterium]